MVSPLRQLALVSVTLLALVPLQAAHAQVNVTGTRTGSFVYTFSVFNGSNATLAALSLDIPVNSTLTNLVAPTGFLIAYDANPALDGSLPGRVDFLEDADPFTLQAFDMLTTISGFSFESGSSFAPSTYVGLDINGTSYLPPPGGVTFPGVTVLTAAPEPGTLALITLAGVPAALLLRRNRRGTASLLTTKGTISSC
ncbi:PEP-CTERM sorting domain-containing protein [Armatimonas sp.]|uniref:PEP-CTERM sorting domain-containing protein n=1 Tax=Armatimonas sp. TaxID=1872638 RepID=UPI00286C603E|nr:PEP-CTERM sorting domain-containing protein [Armatimonas sp.]